MSKRGFLAVDIGGTKLSVGVVSLTGEVLSHGRAMTPQVHVWQALEELIKTQVAESGVELISCGVGCGGPMSPHGELVSTLHIPEWREFPLRAKLQTHNRQPKRHDYADTSPPCSSSRVTIQAFRRNGLCKFFVCLQILLDLSKNLLFVI